MLEVARANLELDHRMWKLASRFGGRSRFRFEGSGGCGRASPLLPANEVAREARLNFWRDGCCKSILGEAIPLAAGEARAAILPQRYLR
jgi:hypothetical protein